jgi:hypothetical protein
LNADQSSVLYLVCELIVDPSSLNWPGSLLSGSGSLGQLGSMVPKG